MISHTPPIAATGLPNSLAVVTTVLRAGTVLGIWPVLIGSHGVATENLLPYLLHLIGSIATVLVVLSGRPILVLIAIAFTGYSTIVLGINAPLAVGVAVWSTGGLALVGLAVAALRRGYRAATWAWGLGGVLAVAAAVGLTILFLE